MQKNAQGALEYLLMIGAAVLVVAIVIIAISGVITSSDDQNVNLDYNSKMNDLRDLIGGADNKDSSQILFNCTGNVPLNASICSGDSTGLTENTIISIVSSCTVSKKCEYYCISGYHLSNGACSPDSVTYSCTGTTPQNSSLCEGDDEDLTANTNKTLVNECSSSKCEYLCNAGYILKNGQCAESTINVGCTNGTKTSIIFESKNYYLCTYQSDGTFSIDSDLNVEILIVAGGGAGGTDAGGGGGAGGLIHIPSLQLYSGNYAVMIGAGGTGGAKNPDGVLPTSGGNSSFSDLLALGGGYGGYYSCEPAAEGGSGGGASSWYCGSGIAGTGIQSTQSGDSGTYGHGFNGSADYSGGGAGGMGNSCVGGIGMYFEQFSSVGGSPAGWFAGGGSGVCSETLVNGGGGRGNNWKDNLDPSCNGVANTGGGGGGGGGGAPGAYGCNGGSGIVIVKYPA